MKLKIAFLGLMICFLALFACDSSKTKPTVNTSLETNIQTNPETNVETNPETTPTDIETNPNPIEEGYVVEINGVKVPLVDSEDAPVNYRASYVASKINV